MTFRGRDMRHPDRDQSLLLERYWAALRGNHAATPPAPPAGLDRELADLAARLDRDFQPNNASPAFLNDLERRLRSEAAVRLDGRAPWTRPAIDRRRSRTPLPTSDTDTDSEETTMANVTGTPGDFPVSLQQRLAREWLKIAAAVVAFVIAGTLLVLTLRDDDDPSVPGVAPKATPTVTTSAPTPDAPDATATVGSAATVPAAVSPTADRTVTAAVARTATAAAQATADASLPGPGTVIATIQVGAVPEIHTFAAGSLWVSNIEDQTISRIDVATNTLIATIPVGGPTNHPAMIAAWGDEIWVLNPADQTLMQIDPATNTIATTISLGLADDGVYDPQRLAVSDGAIWVSDTLNNRVARIDPATGDVVASIEDIGTPHSIGATADGIWVASVINQYIVRIDPATNTIAARIGTPDLGLNGVHVAGEEVWAGGPAHIVRIDPATNAIAESIALPEPIFFDYGGTIGVGDGSIWFAAPSPPTPDEVMLYHIDIATQSVTALLRTSFFFGPAYADGSLWLTGIEDNTVTRIDPTP